jgi:hypothetical protein
MLFSAFQGQATIRLLYPYAVMRSLAANSLRSFRRACPNSPATRRVPCSTLALALKGQGSADAALSWVEPANRRDVARVLEIAERAAQRWDVVWTDFLSPPIVADSMAALASRTDVVCLPWGGYSQAERCRCVPRQRH